jgi:hypothetical protein
MKTLIAATAAGGLMMMVAASAAAQAPGPAEDHAAHASAQAAAGAAAPAAADGEAAGEAAEEPHDMSAMNGALGSYRMTREASGTAWQPDASVHEGIHVMQKRWTFMAHATINYVADWQGGPRGDDKRFVSGMVMLSARRDLANFDSLNFRAMLSPDPFMGKRGYPLLLASGETADGVEGLVDRQHPHDLFMELSASYTHRFSQDDSVFVYAGLPGEPAFGPPAFMHRLSIMDSPEAPISHHWLDSTHITFGVATLGWVHQNWKLEASRFRGREPDEHRYDIETGDLDSTSARLSWNPTENWSLQGSWAHVKSPEQLEPDDDQTRWSASAIYTRKVGDGGLWSSTAAWGRRRATGGENLDAFVLESTFKPNPAWTFFARAEVTENNELTHDAGGDHGPTYTVGKASVGAIRDWGVSEHASIGLGALYAVNAVPGELERSYGGDKTGGMVFVRLKIR